MEYEARFVEVHEVCWKLSDHVFDTCVFVGALRHVRSASSQPRLPRTPVEVASKVHWCISVPVDVEVSDMFLALECMMVSAIGMVRCSGLVLRRLEVVGPEWHSGLPISQMA